jgi:ATP-dependent helicase/nuclease subunit B
VPSTVTAITGTTGSRKTELLLRRYRAVLSSRPPGTALWLAPTSRAAGAIRARLLGEGLPSCFAPGISTFARFAESILARSPHTVRRLSSLLTRQIVRQLVEEESRQGRLPHFGPIAPTGGLLDLLCNFIRQMKRLEIWPDQFAAACEKRGFTPKDRELLAIYRAYQQHLVDHDLYDAEGLLWSARDLLHRQASGYRFIVADGFSDFTRTEHDILEDLAAHAEEIWITLPLNDAEGRPDLFQKPRKTVDELRRRHQNLQVRQAVQPDLLRQDEYASQPNPVSQAGKPDLRPAISHLERYLFANPRGVPPTADTDGLEILTAGRQIGEVELIGRRIKRLLLDGDAAGPVRPGEIVVVYHQPQAVADLVGEVFQRLRIPFYIESGRSLALAPAIIALLRLLELHVEDWPMHKLLGVLGSNYFAPRFEPEIAGNVLYAGIVERRIRSLQIPRVRDRFLEQASRLANGAFVHKLLRGLADALDRLPPRGTLSDQARAWMELAEEMGILRAMSDDDQAAWNQLQDALQESGQLAAWLGQEAPQLDSQKARQALLDILAGQTLSPAYDETGRVRVLSAASARHLQTPYLFLAGLSEQSFPAADREDGVYSQAERQRLIEAGLPLPSRIDRQTDEMLLFYEIVTSATRRLYLSFPAVNEKGEPLTPSPYVQEVAQALGGAPIARCEQIDLSPVPDEGDLCSDDAFRIRAVYDAGQGKAARLAGLVKHREATHRADLLAALGFTLSRQDRDVFGASEGLLSAATVGSLEAVFPPDRIYNATDLEGYATCPYQFFLKKVLRVEPLEEIELEIDYMERGQSAHAVLAAFHRRVKELSGDKSPAALDPAEFDRLLKEAVDEVLGQSEFTGGKGGDAMREIDRRILLQWLADYREQHENYDGLWRDCDQPTRPMLFEVPFGRPVRDGESGTPAAATAPPLELTSDGETVRLGGRIDRIDLGEVDGQAIFNILDYKTGSSTRFKMEDCLRGTVLQLPLYALAARELILGDRDALPWQAGYWYVSNGGFKPKQALIMNERVNGRLKPTETWETIHGRLSGLVVGLVRAIRQGQFPVYSLDPNCTGRCPYKTVCRINHVRSLEKKWRSTR